MGINCRILAAALVMVLTSATGAAADSEDAQFKKSVYQGLSWRNIGPFRGGRSTAVTGVPGQSQLYYFGSVGGGLWRTQDAGLNWKNVTDGQIKSGSVGAVAVAPSDANVIYLGMGESPVRGVMTTHGDGVYRSTDRGASWQHLGLADSRHISRIRVHPGDPDTVWVAVQGHLWGPSDERGIFKSTDGGVSWRQVLEVQANTGASDLSLDATNPRVLYAAMWQHQRYPWTIESGGEHSGIWKSSNGGETWKRLEEGLPDNMGKVGVAVSPANPDRVWAIIEAEEGGLYRSDDAGKSWAKINDERVLLARSWYYMHITADSRDANTVYVLNAPMMKSSDGGKTFARIATPHGDNHDLWINPDDNQVMINANDGGANISFNGGASWSTQGNQPTAQFYRVITDNQFPYKVYGGQQDNSAIAIQSRSMSGQIDQRHWHRIGGCESAYAAFDPENPRYVYGTCIQGFVSEYDIATHTERDVMPYPMVGLGYDARDLRHRFNWNPPLIASPHEPTVLYYGGNVVLRSSDRGRSWTVISPDLTRNEVEKQGAGGGPITNEAAGGEVYNTLLSLVESPHRPGELWAGSDDGRLHVTRNSGDDWQEVSPPRIGEAMINAIDISPHDADTIRVAATRYKLDELQPMILVTNDGGRSWRKRVNGLPDDLITRVVREDSKRPGLLYAGTETGVWLSFDAGGQWQRMGLNLPAVPVTDLVVHGDDLVIATQGRAFWILDDLGPLRQLDDAPVESDFHLFNPTGGYRTEGFRNANASNAGMNPDYGVAIDFLLAESLVSGGDQEQDDSSDQPVLTLEIVAGDGRVVHTVKAETPEDKAASKLEPKAGHNRYVWDLRHDRVTYLADTLEFPSWNGHRVAPGAYTVRLSLGEAHSQQQSLQVWPDPRKSIRGPDFAAQQELLLQIRQRVNAIHATVLLLRDARGQVEDLLDRVSELPAAEAFDSAGKALLESIDALERELIQPKQETQQDIVNFRSQLGAEYLFLAGLIDGSDPPVNAGGRERLQDLDTQWAEQQRAFDELLAGPMAAFNTLFEEHAVPAVILKR